MPSMVSHRKGHIAIALLAGLLVAGCASKKDGLPDSAAGLGLGGANGIGGAGNVTPGSPQDFTVNVGDRIFFTTDSSDINAQAQQTLQRQAQWLNQNGQYAITIEGHADERGTREYNLALGERRANSVKNYLIASGINPSRLRVISYGKERPAVPGSDPSAWAQNRRAVTEVE